MIVDQPTQLAYCDVHAGWVAGPVRPYTEGRSPYRACERCIEQMRALAELAKSDPLEARRLDGDR